jgi:hypothetical protein
MTAVSALSGLAGGVVAHTSQASGAAGAGLDVLLTRHAATPRQIEHESRVSPCTMVATVRQ